MPFAVITAAEAKAIEQAACTQMDLPLLSLMQSAGEAAARQVQQIFPNGRVLVLCGPGGNGGDGYVAARFLLAEGRSVSVISSRPIETLSGDTRKMAHAWTACGGITAVFGNESLGHLDASDVIIDALLGIGTTSAPAGSIAALCAFANDSPAKVVSLDIATGINSDTADVYAGAIQADVTIAFIAPKRGNILFPGAGHTGKLCIAPLALDLLQPGIDVRQLLLRRGVLILGQHRCGQQEGSAQQQGQPRPPCTDRSQERRHASHTVSRGPPRLRATIRHRR